MEKDVAIEGLALPDENLYSTTISKDNKKVEEAEKILDEAGELQEFEESAWFTRFTNGVSVNNKILKESGESCYNDENMDNVAKVLDEDMKEVVEAFIGSYDGRALMSESIKNVTKAHKLYKEESMLLGPDLNDSEVLDKDGEGVKSEQDIGKMSEEDLEEYVKSLDGVNYNEFIEGITSKSTKDKIEAIRNAQNINLLDSNANDMKEDREKSSLGDYTGEQTGSSITDFDTDLFNLDEDEGL